MLKNGFTKEDTIIPNSGQIKKAVTGADLLNDFANYHLAYRGYYDADFWRREKAKLDQGASSTRSGAKTKVVTAKTGEVVIVARKRTTAKRKPATKVRTKTRKPAAKKAEPVKTEPVKTENKDSE